MSLIVFILFFLSDLVPDELESQAGTDGDQENDLEEPGEKSPEELFEELLCVGFDGLFCFSVHNFFTFLFT